MSTSDKAKDRAVRLIDYLTELGRLQSDGDIKDNKSTLWVHEFPRNFENCYTQAWGVTKGIAPNIWIQVKKYEGPVLDEIPEICKEWVNYSTLKNTESNPELLHSISVNIEDQSKNSLKKTEDQDDTNIQQAVDVIGGSNKSDLNSEKNDSEQTQGPATTKTINLVYYPKVSSEWKRYVAFQWRPWAELQRRWQSVQRIYGKLTTIHKDQQKLGGECELVVGIGFLTWNTPADQIVCRHLVTTKVALSFEAGTGCFIVTPLGNENKLTTELAGIDLGDRASNVKDTLNKGLISANSNPWDRASIGPVFTDLVNSLSDNVKGEYNNDLRPSENSPGTLPTVDYAPALILRNQTGKGLEQTLLKMRDNIHNGGDIPDEFKHLCECRANREHMSEDQAQSEAGQTIYFPKDSNDEQRQIVQKLQSSTGVLVQGPTGTGKSYTITNLICHLLATNQRVLVTAKTPRALQTLHEKIPQKLRPLCLNLLGNVIEDQKSLEASVSSIINENDKWDEAIAEEKINGLSKINHQLESEKTEICNRLRSIRESEVAQHSILNGNYSGTAAKIVLQLQKEASKYNWLRDKIPYNTELPVSPERLMKLYGELCLFTPEQISGVQLLVPCPEKDLPTYEEFCGLAKQESEANACILSLKPLLGLRQGQIIGSADLNHVHGIVDSVAKLNASVESMVNRPIPWIKQAVSDTLIGNSTPWKRLLDVLSRSLVSLNKSARKIEGQTLIIPEDLDHKKLLKDAMALKQHFDVGWQNKLWHLQPKAIRDLMLFIESVRIDGRQCNTPETIDMLIEHLTFEQKIDYYWKLWEGYATRKSGVDVLQVAELEKLKETLDCVLLLNDLLKTSKESILRIPGLSMPDWHNQEEVNKLLDVCRAVISSNAIPDIQVQLDKHISKIESFAYQSNAHPVAGEAVSILKHRKVCDYPNLLNKIAELHKFSERALWAKNTLNKLYKVAPIMAGGLSSGPNDQRWATRMKFIEQAWDWSRANSWLRSFLNKDDLPSLERRLKKVHDDISLNLTELSAIRAWKFCFSRMDNNHLSHLIGWQQEIGKVGRGTVEMHGHKHRHNAHIHLNKCKEAVPSWIMPLDMIYENVQAGPGIFDVIIVDEATQCGPESLPLAYLSKRLLIMGDDQQMDLEPEEIDKEKTFSLMKKYLNDFEHADSFDAETSLFDHAKRRFKNKIILREHFRCMPEIIHFSNDISYRSMPLIPLRQYSPQRLVPLKLVHVPNGHMEGSGGAAINSPEAEKLVETVLQCCHDNRYKDKTMGVIILHGNAQVALIEDMLLKKLGADKIEKHKLICGGPYKFQGDERHIIFLGMVTAPNMMSGPLTQPSDKRRFNVAVSRAKDQVWLFHTATCNDMDENCLRRRLIEHFRKPAGPTVVPLGEEVKELQKLMSTSNHQIEKPPKPFDCWFELDIALRIASKGYRVVPHYPIAGKEIDIVIEGTQSKLAVECCGDHWHGPEWFKKDIERRHKLERCGWRFYRIKECIFNADQEKTLAALWKELDNLGIKPFWKEKLEFNVKALQSRLKKASILKA